MDSEQQIRVVRYDDLDDTNESHGEKQARKIEACIGVQKGEYANEDKNWKILQKTSDPKKNIELICGSLGGKGGKKARKSKKSRKSKRKSKKQKKKTRKSRK